MLDPKEMAKLDQSGALLSETMPSLVRGLYNGYKEVFTEQQAWELVRITVFAMSGGRGVLQ
jgi:hypothetical protein